MTPDLHKQIDKQINSINSITFHQSLGVFSKFDLDMPTPKIQSVFFMDRFLLLPVALILKISTCGHLQIVEEEGFSICNIWSFSIIFS